MTNHDPNTCSDPRNCRQCAATRHPSGRRMHRRALATLLVRQTRSNGENRGGQ
jgi:hypothetical protein